MINLIYFLDFSLFKERPFALVCISVCLVQAFSFSSFLLTESIETKVVVIEQKNPHWLVTFPLVKGRPRENQEKGKVLD